MHVYWFVELHFKFSHFYRYQVLGKNTTTIKIWFRDHYLRAILSVLTRHESYIDIVTHILHGFAENCIIHKFA